MIRIEYNRQKVFEYAERWAFFRNPAYYDFDSLGGDCTNFASQCLYAGAPVMNYTRDTGWYYINLNNRAAAWTSAEYFRRFMLGNNGFGPVAEKRNPFELEKGDFISLMNGGRSYHTLIVVGFDGSMPLIAAHTYNAFMRRLDSYYYDEATGIHIKYANK
jgi:hypothetical protein